MHDLFYQVLTRRDLSKAGDLFTLADADIAGDLTEVLQKIEEIATAQNYLNNDNNQSVVEICITRVTSAIRETGSIEKHAGALVSLLQSCLQHNLRPSVRDEDPPHAKIASDVLSCVFLHYSRRGVMEQVVPVAARFLHQGNKGLVRSVSSYLSLVAIGNAALLARNVTPILDSCTSGNRSLVRVLPQLYAHARDAVAQRVPDLLRLLPACEAPERACVLQLLTMIAKDRPNLLEPHVGALCDYLTTPSTSAAVLALFGDMAPSTPHAFAPHLSRLKASCEATPGNLALAAQVIGPVGKTNKVIARDCMTFLVAQLPVADSAASPVLLREVRSISDRYPAALPDLIAQISRHAPAAPAAARAIILQLQELCAKIGSSAHLPDRRSAGIQTEGTVTVVTLGNPSSSAAHARLTNHLTGSLTSASLSSLALTQYRNASTSTREINFPGGSSLASAAHLTPSGYALASGTPAYLHAAPSAGTLSIHHAGSGSVAPASHGGVVTPAAVMALAAASSKHSLSSRPTERSQSQHSILDKAPAAPGPIGTSVHAEDRSTAPSSVLPRQPASLSHHHRPAQPAAHHHSHPAHSRSHPAAAAQQASAAAAPVMPVVPQPPPPTALVTPTQLAHHPSLPPTVAASASAPTNTYTGQPHAIPFRDAVQQFCEKHMDKIKAYMDHVLVTLPVPIKAKMEEHKHKRHCRLHFVCFGRGAHCLYPQNFFSFRTRNPRTWIHLMFLAVQARSARAVCQQDPSVGNLKACWDTLKLDSGNSFVRLVTSSFPSARDQDSLLQELHSVRYFDVFEFNASEKQWACFVCNHPEKVDDLLRDGSPVMEGQLKEKKGRWKFLKRWKTRYFTLSGAAITYNKKDSKETLPVNKIQSVKAVRKGIRDIPKAFEIFTTDQTYVFKVKDGKKAEQWVQCLQIAVARSSQRDAAGDTAAARQRQRDADLMASGWDFGSGLVMPLPAGSGGGGGAKRGTAAAAASGGTGNQSHTKL